MMKNAFRFMVLGAAIYGGAVLISKVSQKMKLKKTGGDPKSVKWLK